MNSERNSDEALLTSVDGLLATPDTENGATMFATEVNESDLRNYSLDGLNITGSVPLEKVVRAVKRFRDGTHRPDVDRPRLSILLSGVPGGGKTAFVRYLAREVGAKLEIYRASDLLSKWIGENEKNLAAAFKFAAKDNAILFLDEVDSFLMSREGATKNWESSGVNELLQQMENFGGVFIAATNAVDALDRAALRRFTFKLELGYLTDDGKRAFFARYFKTPLSEDEARRLDAIDNLAPGDFRTVKEELFYVCDEETNAERLAALAAESAAKRGRCRTPIGFNQ